MKKQLCALCWKGGMFRKLTHVLKDFNLTDRVPVVTERKVCKKCWDNFPK